MKICQIAKQYRFSHLSTITRFFQSSSNTPLSRHNEAIIKEFAKQAPKYSINQLNRIQELQWILNKLPLQPHYQCLDVSAGTGALTNLIAPKVKSIIGIDISEEMLEQARNNSRKLNCVNVQFQRMNAEMISFTHEQFDLVTSRLAIHHWEKPETIIREMVRVCKQDGYVALIDIVTLNEYNQRVREKQQKFEKMRDPSHLWMFTPNELSELVKKLGLTVVDECFHKREEMVDRWLDLSGTPEQEAKYLRTELGKDVGKNESGFEPFVKDNQLWFVHTYFMIVAKKDGLS